MLSVSQKLREFSEVLESSAAEACDSSSSDALEVFCRKVSMVCIALRAESRRARGVTHDLCALCVRPLESPVASICCSCRDTLEKTKRDRQP